MAAPDICARNPQTTKAELTRFIDVGSMLKAATLLAVCDVCVPILMAIASMMGPAVVRFPAKVLVMTPTKAENQGINLSMKILP